MDDQVQRSYGMNRRRFLRTALVTGSAAMVATALPRAAFAETRFAAPAFQQGLAQIPRNQTLVLVRGGTQGKFIED